MEMLPPGPSWKCHTINPPAPTKRPIALFYRNAIDCIQSLLSHPFFECHISFVPRKVWSTAARVVRIYNKWLTGDHAWELQVGICCYVYRTHYHLLYCRANSPMGPLC